MPCETFESEVVESTKDVLQQWNDYYIHNDFGIGILCDKCRKWRKVKQYKDRREVPSVWICSMWKIDEFRRGSCRIPSDLKEEDFGEAIYSPGDLVWAKMSGYDWWPGMIEDCPDTQDYFIHYVDSEHEYHVIFFGDKPTRNWIKASRIKEFSTSASPLSKKKCKGTLLKSIEQANKALKMSVKERLMNFSFAVRYKGRWAKINKEEVVMPPQTREMKKSTETISRLICDKPCAEQDCSETVSTEKMENNKLKSKVDSEKKPVDDAECHSIRSEEEIIKNDSENPHFDIGDEGRQFFALKNDEELVKSKMLYALRIILNRLVNTKNLTKSISTHEDNKNSATNHCQQPSLKEESDRSEGIEIVRDGRCNYGNKVPISEENSEEVNMAEIINTPIIIKIFFQGNSIKIISKNGDEFIVSYEDLFWEMLRTVYPPDSTGPSTLNDADNESLLDTDIDSNCSNRSSNQINDCENVGAILESEPATADEDKTFVEKESGDIEENKTLSESESVVSFNNETFLKNEPVTKDEKEESFSDAETIIDDENELTFSDNDRINDKKEATCSENELVLNNKVNSTLSNGESVVIIENIATSSENNLDQRNTDSYLENHSNVSMADRHSSYIPNSTPVASITFERSSPFSGNNPINDEIGTSFPNNLSSNNLVVNHRNATSYLTNYSNVSAPFSYASYLTQKVSPTYTFGQYSTFSNNEPMINDKNAATFSKNNLDPRNATSYLENVSVPYYQASYLPYSTSETPCTSKSEPFSTSSGSEPVINDQSVASFSENGRVVDLRKAAIYSQINPSVSVECSHASYLPHSTSELSVNCENEQYSNQRKRIKRK